MRTIAIGFCPLCKRSVEIWQELEECEWGPPKMNCTCGATITEVEFPLEQGKWQFLLAKPGRVRAERIRKGRQLTLFEAAQ